MKYISTRGQSPEVGFEDALLAAYAPDGGLYVPKDIPKVPWREWRGKSFQGIATSLLPHFGVPQSLISHDSIQKAYSTFDTKSIVKLHELESDLAVMELFHGPTLSFKDYSLGLIGELLQNYLAAHKRHHIVTVATSGDTGSSAMTAVAGKENIDIVCLYPMNRISDIQRRQMTTIDSTNVHLIGVDGTSDELDDILRDVFAQQDDILKGSKSTIGCINSTNWGRILVQTTHWFYTYFHMTSDSDQPLNIAIPTGAAGNITAGFYAKAMGLPIKIKVCTGLNDCLVKMVREGTLVNSPCSMSLASAMDIQIPYNIERVLHLLTNGDHELVRSVIVPFCNGKDTTLSEHLHEKVKSEIEAFSVTDKEIRETVKMIWTKYGYHCCPHTATALKMALEHPEMRPLACCATASPQKFPEVQSEEGIEFVTDENIRNLLEKHEKHHLKLDRSHKHMWSEMVNEEIKRLVKA